MALPAVYNFTIKQGTTINKELTWTNAENSPIRLQDCEIVFEILAGRTHYHYDKDSGHILVPSDHVCRIKIPASETILYKFDKAPYELFVTIPNGDVIPILQGTITNKKKFKRQ